MNRDILELERIVADMRLACERWERERREVTLRPQEIPGRDTMRFNSKGEAYYE